MVNQVLTGVVFLAALTFMPGKASAQVQYAYATNANFAGYPYYRSVTGKIYQSGSDQIRLRLTSPLYGINGAAVVYFASGELTALQNSIGRTLRVNENIQLGLMCSGYRDISFGYLAGGWLVIGGGRCRFRNIGVAYLEPVKQSLPETSSSHSTTSTSPLGTSSTTSNNTGITNYRYSYGGYNNLQ